MPIDVRMPDGTLVKNVPDNITQADLAARFDAFKAQPVTSTLTVAPEIQVTPQAPQVGPEGAPVPSILQTQTQVSEDRPIVGSAKKGIVNLQQTGENLRLANLMELQDAYKQQYGQEYENAPQEKIADLQKLEEDINTSKRVSTSYDLKRQTLSKQYGITPLSQKLDEVQSTPEYENANTLQKFQAIGETLLKNPGDIPSYIGNIGLESLPNSMAMMASAILARYMTGSPSSTAVAGGATSSFMEFGNQYVNNREQGKSHQDAMTESAVKSGVIGYFDAVSFGSAGKALEAIIKDFKKGAIKATAKEVGKETGKQAGYGAAGEAVGSVITGQEVDPRAVVEEALGEIAGAPMEAVTTYRSNKALATPTPPPVSERIEPEVTPREPAPTEVSSVGTVSSDRVLLSAQTRLNQIEAKMNGTPDYEGVGPDGKPRTVKGQEPQVITDQERSEYDFLKNNINNLDAIAKTYGLTIDDNIKSQQTQTTKPVTSTSESHDTQAMMDELSGKSVEYIPEPDEVKAVEQPKEEKKTIESAPNTFQVDTEDAGSLGVQLIKHPTLGSYLLLADNGFSSEINAEHAAMLGSPEEIIKYYMDGFGVKSVASAVKEEPTGPIAEEDKEFTPVGGRLINEADVDKLNLESATALEQNLKNQEIQRDKQIRREIREDKFPAAETPSLSSTLKDLGGINVSNKLDMLKDTGKVFNYESAFSKDGEDLLTYIENGSLDEYLPHQLRLSNTPPNEAFDPRPGYDYISSVIESKQKVHDYEYELAKIDHENKIREKYLAKQYMEPNEAAQAAAAEIQGKEYMNIKPDEIVPPLTKGAEVGTMEWLTEDNPPVHSLYEGNKSLKVEMNKLVRDIESGRASDTEVKDAVLNIYETTKKPKVDQPLVRGPEHIKRRLLEAKLNGTLSPKAVDMAEWLINKNPEIMRESAISIKEEPKGNKKAGEYVPEKRLIQLFNHIGDEKTPVHESLHSVERLLPEDIRSGIRKAWLNNLFKEYNSVSKGKDENLKQYFKGIVDYHLGENPIGDVVAKDLIKKGLVDKSNYQFFNPSEFWAIRGSDIVADRFNAEISKSTVNKLRQWIKEFIQKLKSTFGLNSNAPIIRALDSLAKSDGKFKTNDMLAESAEYASISQPPKNIKGQEVLPQWRGPEESKTDLWIYRLQNKQIDTKRVQELIGDIEEDWNVYDKEQLYHGRTASGIRNFLLKDLLPVIKDIERLKITPEEVRTYLHNRHAEERNIQMNKINPDIYDPKTGRTTPNPLKDKGSGISTTDAKAYLAGLDPAKKQILEDVAKKFDQMIKGTQQILISSGAESADTIAKWNKTYEHYVPLFRVEDEMARPSGMGGVGQGFGTRGNFSKRAMGSEKDVQDILSNIIAQRERALIRAEKIRVGRALYGLAIQSPNPDFWLPINPDAIRNKKQAIAELKRMGIPDAEDVVNNLMKEPKERYLQKVNVAEGGIEPDEDFDFDSGLPVNESKEVVASKINVMARYKDFVFPIRINGKDRYIFFNKNDPRALRMVQSLKNLDVENLGWAVGIAGKFTRWFKNVNTQYNPVFGLVNFIRDSGGALLNLTNTEIAGEQVKVLAGAYKAMGGILNVHRAERKGKAPSTGPWATLYQEYRDEGSQTGYRDSLIRNQEEMQIIEHTLEQFKDGNTKKAFYSVLGGLTDFNDMMENSIRLSAYKVALDKGLSKQKAAIIAKNLTVNFDRKGAWTAQVNALYAFFNASIQGTERIYRTITGPKGKIIIGGGILAGMVQAVMLAAAGYDEDDPPEFVREKNFIIPLADGTYFTVPYPLGYNVLPSSGRIVMEFMLHGGKNPGKHIASFTSAVINSVNPLGSSGLATQTLMPTVIDPLIALGENRDSFGRPISREDRATSPTPGYSRSRETSTALGKGIAEFLNWASGGDKYVKGKISPTGDDVDFLAGQVGGGLYREISKAAKAVGSTITGEEIPAYRRPIVGRFIGETGSNASISQTFYENVTRLTDHENTIKGLKKDKLPTDSYKAKNPEARLWPRANSIENEVNAINKQKRLAIEKNKPKEVIQRLDEKKARIMKHFNDQVKKANAD
jgi:hypothetical protein